MKNFFGRFIALSFGALAIISSLSINSCRQNTSVKWDTLVVHDTLPDLDDSTSTSGWTYHSAGNSGLVALQFTDGKNFPAAEWNVGGSNGVVLRSTDTGKTWPAVTPVPNGGTLYGIWFFDQWKGFALGDGGLWRTNDGGQSWNGMYLNSNYYLRSLYFVDKSVGFIGTADPTQNPLPGQNGEIWKTSDGGATWNEVYNTMVSNSQPGTGGIYNFQFTSATHGIATGKFGMVLVTNDGGNTWTQGNSGVTGSIAHTAFVGGNTIFAVVLGNSYDWPADTVGGAVIKTTDGGMNWQTVQTTSYAPQGIATNGNGVITAAGFGGNILESRDNGMTWAHGSFGGDRWINIGYAAPYRAVMIGTFGHLVTRDR